MSQTSNRWISVVVMTLLLLSGSGLALANDDEGMAETLAGCLAEVESGFVLQTADGDVALEGEGLDAHVGHTVKVTGEWEESDGERYFAVSEMEHVSASCEA